MSEEEKQRIAEEAKVKAENDLTEKEVSQRVLDCLREITPHFSANDPLIEMIKKLEPIVEKSEKVSANGTSPDAKEE